MAARAGAEAAPSPVLDVSARKALVEEAAGKSTREVERMLASVDPTLVAPREKVRRLADGKWELKAVIDDECERGLKELKRLLSHTNPSMTYGELVGRLVREGLDRHDPGRRATSAPKAKREPASDATSAAKLHGDADPKATSAPKSEAKPASNAPSAVKPQRRADAKATSAAKSERNPAPNGTSPTESPTAPDRASTSAPKERAGVDPFSWTHQE